MLWQGSSRHETTKAAGKEQWKRWNQETPLPPASSPCIRAASGSTKLHLPHVRHVRGVVRVDAVVGLFEMPDTRRTSRNNNPPYRTISSYCPLQ